MKLTERMYQAVEEIWKSYLTHPFVAGLADGSLAPEKFRFYLIQDYRYLLEYVKVFALGIVKAKDEALMARFTDMVHGTLCGEMDIHKAYMKRLGASDEEIQNTPTSLINQSYTSYMLDVAFKGDVLDILAAVLSCAWSYQVIGAHHKDTPGATHPLFGEWVSGYSGEEYAQNTQEIIDLLDELGADISPEKEAYLTEIFINCSRYEYGFWDMAWNMQL